MPARHHGGRARSVATSAPSSSAANRSTNVSVAAATTDPTYSAPAAVGRATNAQVEDRFVVPAPGVERGEVRYRQARLLDRAPAGLDTRDARRQVVEQQRERQRVVGDRARTSTAGWRRRPSTRCRDRTRPRCDSRCGPVGGRPHRPPRPWRSTSAARRRCRSRADTWRRSGRCRSARRRPPTRAGRGLATTRPWSAPRVRQRRATTYRQAPSAVRRSRPGAQRGDDDGTEFAGFVDEVDPGDITFDGRLGERRACDGSPAGIGSPARRSLDRAARRARLPPRRARADPPATHRSR